MVRASRAGGVTEHAAGNREQPSDTPPRQVDVALRNGSTLHLRGVREGDAPAMRAFFEALSVESIWLRFFGMPSVDWVTEWAAEVGQHAHRYGLVATTGPDQTIV